MQRWYNNIDPVLKDVIQSILVLDSNDPPAPEDLPIFTNGMPALLCTSLDQEDHLSLFGKAVPTERWAEWGNATLIAFFFKPFAIGPVFKLSAQQLKNEVIGLNRWNPQKAMALTIQLTYAQSTAEKMEVLHQFILSQVTANQRECAIIRYATDKILENPEADVLGQMLQELNLTERTFQRIFKKYVGITASEYRRICQFQLAFYQLKSGQFDKLTDVAYANGYFDQSHYVRSFKEFTETTPNDYLQFGLKKK
ncbi:MULTISPECIES: AraC family transcriptional regulator [Niastella]|uniref:Helix-turn-helix transcriptional regulator n=1 Tax=Niastella soli TaxID=2821487 RepID=A0ABS3YRD8_9BACT|nr:AraC family transcriptional regulator [Niastella soli]MBO9200489.1 helix-turn-helix transcriptional regulator [Niastella soli]